MPQRMIAVTQEALNLQETWTGHRGHSLMTPPSRLSLSFGTVSHGTGPTFLRGSFHRDDRVYHANENARHKTLAAALTVKFETRRARSHTRPRDSTRPAGTIQVQPSSSTVAAHFQPSVSQREGTSIRQYGTSLQHLPRDLLCDR